MTGGLHVEVVDSVAVLSIDRPRVRNAIDLATARLIAAALDDVDSDDTVRAAVLTGTDAVFSAGMDLKAFAATGERPVVPGRGAFGICARATDKPLIAAVEGTALGGGFEIALACDLVVAAEDAWFGLPEVTRGLVAAAGGVVRLPRLVPRKIALELLLTGRPMDAATAHRLGMVNSVVPSGTAKQAAFELATVIAGNAPMAVRTTKYLAIASADWAEAELFERQQPYTEKVRSSADAAEGARAFVEKRTPSWSGH